MSVSPAALYYLTKLIYGPPSYGNHEPLSPKEWAQFLSLSATIAGGVLYIADKAIDTTHFSPASIFLFWGGVGAYSMVTLASILLNKPDLKREQSPYNVLKTATYDTDTIKLVKTINELSGLYAYFPTGKELYGRQISDDVIRASNKNPVLFNRLTNGDFKDLYDEGATAIVDGYCQSHLPKLDFIIHETEQKLPKPCTDIALQYKQKWDAMSAPQQRRLTKRMEKTK